MSNNKQTMKLYTEFEIKFAMDVARCQLDKTFDEVLEELTPIELPSDEEIEPEMYYIQNGFSGNAIVWWRKDSKGYTSDLNEAGKYTKEFAFNQVNIGRAGEYAWLCSYVDAIQNKPICIFVGTLDYSERIDADKIQGGNK